MSGFFIMSYREPFAIRKMQAIASVGSLKLAKIGIRETRMDFLQLLWDYIRGLHKG